MKHTYKERLIAGLKALGYSVDKTNRSKYTALTHPGRELKSFIGANGAFRIGKSASNSTSIGDPGNQGGAYKKVLRKGDEALTPPDPSPGQQEHDEVMRAVGHPNENDPEQYAN